MRWCLFTLAEVCVGGVFMGFGRFAPGLVVVSPFFMPFWRCMTIRTGLHQALKSEKVALARGLVVEECETKI